MHRYNYTFIQIAKLKKINIIFNLSKNKSQNEMDTIKCINHKLGLLLNNLSIYLQIFKLKIIIRF